MTTIEAADKTPAEAFAIDSLDRLAWYGRKRAAYLAEIDLIKQSAEAMIADAQKGLQALDDRFQVQAEDFARQTLQATGAKTKTLKTLGGAFAFRTVPGGIRKDDAAALLAWAKEQAPDLVERQEIVKEDVPDAKLKAYFESTGEIPPGALLAEDRETFTHKPGKD